MSPNFGERFKRKRFLAVWEEARGCTVPNLGSNQGSEAARLSLTSFTLSCSFLRPRKEVNNWFGLPFISVVWLLLRHWLETLELENLHAKGI